MGIEYDMQEIKDEFWALKQQKWNKKTVKQLFELANQCQILIKGIKKADDNRNLITTRYLNACKQELNSLKQQILAYRLKMQTIIDIRALNRKMY